MPKYEGRLRCGFLLAAGVPPLTTPAVLPSSLERGWGWGGGITDYDQSAPPQSHCVSAVWLNRHQIAVLFNRDVKTIGKHINNIFNEGELDKKVVVAKFATTTAHGAIQGNTQTLTVDYYNLDVIISVGYRVKSREGTLFGIS